MTVASWRRPRRTRLAPTHPSHSIKGHSIPPNAGRAMGARGTHSPHRLHGFRKAWRYRFDRALEAGGIQTTSSVSACAPAAVPPAHRPIQGLAHRRSVGGARGSFAQHRSVSSAHGEDPGGTCLARLLGQLEAGSSHRVATLRETAFPCEAERGLCLPTKLRRDAVLPANASRLIPDLRQEVHRQPNTGHADCCRALTPPPRHRPSPTSR